MNLIDFAIIASMIYAAPDMRPTSRTWISFFWAAVAIVAIIVKTMKGA
jgi:hypothetical protein